MFQAAINSTPFVALLNVQNSCCDEMDYWANALNHRITHFAETVCYAYNQLRTEYNRSQQSNSVFIVPEVRVKESKGRRYLTFRWVQFMNNCYMGNTHEKSRWTVREIKKRGKEHYSRADFQSAMGNKNDEFIDALMAVEHCLRYCREKYQLVNQIHTFGRRIRLSDTHMLLASDYLNCLEGDDKQTARAIKQKFKAGIFIEDPLELPSRISLFDDFYDLPEKPINSDEETEEFNDFFIDEETKKELLG